MTEENKIKLALLEEQYKEAHTRAALEKQNKDEIAEQIKEIIGDEDYEDENIKVMHVSRKNVDYKGMVTDSQIKIPDRYISYSTSTRITIQKQK